MERVAAAIATANRKRFIVNLLLFWIMKKILLLFLPPKKKDIGQKITGLAAAGTMERFAGHGRDGTTARSLSRLDTHYTLMQ